MSGFAADLTVVCADDVIAQPWKNGGGVTRELLRLPLPGGNPDDWLLRISVADIEADGPFSSFPGIQRWFAVLSGHGVRLHWPAASARAAIDMTPRDHLLEFDGADPPECQLIDGPTRDLNVMARTGYADAYVRNATMGSASSGRSQGSGVFTRQPLLLGRGGEQILLPARTLAWRHGYDARAWSLAPPPAGADDVPRTAAGGPIAYWIGLLPNAPFDSTDPAATP